MWRRPLQTYGVSAGIYRQALALARKGAPFHPHPGPAGCPALRPSTERGPWLTRSSRARDRSDDRAGGRARLAAGLAKMLGRRIRHGTIVVVDDSGERVLGSGSPTVRVTVHDQRAFRALIRSGSVGLGSSYVNGWWDCDDLTALVQLLERNLAGVGRKLDRWARAVAPVSDRFRRRMITDKNRDRANVRAHYDLGNEFFEQMLDETMSYSCAFFEDPSMSLARGVGGEARADLSQARPRPERSRGGDRLGLGELRRARRGALSAAGSRPRRSPTPSTSTRPSAWPTPVSRPG